MRLVITEKQLKELIRLNSNNIEITEQGGGEGAPEAGTSSDGEQKTGASKWESGVTRGPANQIGVTKWADSYKITRGKANPLSEQNDFIMDRRGNALLNTKGIRSDKDYQTVNKSIDAASKKFGLPGYKISEYIYKADDGENLFINLIKGEFKEALLDLRSVIMTPGGMATQTVIEVIFSESIVVPVVIEALNAAILINDLELYESQGDRDPEAAFRIIEDLIIYITRGTFKLGGNALKKWLKTPNGIKYMEMISTNISKYILSIKLSLNKLPNSGLKKYILSKVGALDSRLIKILLNITGKVVSKIPRNLRKGIISGLLVYISSEAIDKLIGVKPGTTKSEIAKGAGPSDEYMVKIEKITNSKISKEKIKTAEELDILTKKGERKAMASKIVDLYSDVYPCLKDYLNKNLFVVIAATENKDILRINNVEYYDERTGGIYQVKTNKELFC